MEFKIESIVIQKKKNQYSLNTLKKLKYQKSIYM